MAKAPGFAVAKLSPPESNPLGYPNHDRANDVYGIWWAGYTEEEISGFLSIPIEEVEKDLLYINSRLPVRTIIAHQNDRTRILLLRQESDNFRKMMKQSLAQPVGDLLRAGISPAGILKEFREAVGMTQKPEPLLQINTQINTGTPTGGGITSAEDVIRRVLAQINQEEPSEALPEAVDAEVSESEEDKVPDPDED